MPDLELRLVSLVHGPDGRHRAQFEARQGHLVVTRSVASASDSATGLLVVREGDLAIASTTSLAEPLAFAIDFPGPVRYSLYLTAQFGQITAQATFARSIAARRPRSGPFGVAA